MDDLRKSLSRVKLRQTLLLTLPWIILQVGGFWALSTPGIGSKAAIIVGEFAGLLILLLSFSYLLGQARFANMICRESDSDKEFYGVFSLFRLWSDQLEYVRKNIPGYLNTLRVNYISLPLALLAAVLNFWTVAAGMVIVWYVTGGLVRSAVARFASGRDVIILTRTQISVALLLIMAIASWSIIRDQSEREKKALRVAISQAQSAGILLNNSALEHLYYLDGENGVDAVKKLDSLPIVPVHLANLTSSGWMENLPVNAYGELEKFVSHHSEIMAKISQIGRNSAARLGFEFRQGVPRDFGLKLLQRYRKVEEFERLRFYAAAGVGNDRAVSESFQAQGEIRRQLETEPVLAICSFAMTMELRRIAALERLLNEFGIGSDQTEAEISADLARSDREFATNVVWALKGEGAIYLLSGIDPLSKLERFSGVVLGMVRIFPALRYSRYISQRTYLEMIKMYESAVADFKQLLAIEEKLTLLPLGATPAIGALRNADHAVKQYLMLSRKLRAAQVALSLDRYRKAHGMFPDSLKAYSSSTLVDPYTKELLSYKKGEFTVDVIDLATMKTRQIKHEGVKIGWPDSFRLKR
ncbi:MAG: hypothetical protein LBM70_08145 [Victivallales bacterium]|jgi:hypothetical protein|nr:hypothetical protein [Victivallales bacterium]